MSSEATLLQRLDELPAERSQLALQTLSQPLLRGRRFGTVRALYHDHGSSEQFHSELKSELDIEQLPSGKLCVNRIVLLCGMLIFNLLRTLRQEVIIRADLTPVKIKVRCWRLKTVLQNSVYCAVRVIRHGRSIKLHFGKTCSWFAVIEDIAQSRLRPA